MRRWLRDAVRRVTRDWTLVKRLPADLGRGIVYCSPSAMLSMLRPGWWGNAQAQGLFQWVRRFVGPGMKVWDIGANQGLFALAAAHRVGERGSVLALEPDLRMAALIRRSVEAGAANVEILAMAMSDRLGFAKLGIAASDRALNHLLEVKGNPLTGGIDHEVVVPLVSGSWIAQSLGVPDFIKIDVEGAELMVLESLADVLRTYRPRMIVEIAPENYESTHRLIESLEYAIFDANVSPLVQRDCPHWNNLLVPSEKLHERLDFS